MHSEVLITYWLLQSVVYRREVFRTSGLCTEIQKVTFCGSIFLTHNSLRSSLISHFSLHSSLSLHFSLHYHSLRSLPALRLVHYSLWTCQSLLTCTPLVAHFTFRSSHLALHSLCTRLTAHFALCSSDVALRSSHFTHRSLCTYMCQSLPTALRT